MQLANNIKVFNITEQPRGSVMFHLSDMVASVLVLKLPFPSVFTIMVNMTSHVLTHWFNELVLP